MKKSIYAPLWETNEEPARLRTLSVLGLAYIALAATPTLPPLTDPMPRLSGLPEAPVEMMSLVKHIPTEPPLVDELRYPSYLKGMAYDWCHPLADGRRELPHKADRKFGGERPREPRPECGGGHCGVDLGGEPGTPILSVRDGVVAYIEHNPYKSSGLYVRVRHAGGLESEYMHLEDIQPGLRMGQRVKRGTPVGFLGHSGILSSPPHLHFAVSKAAPGGARLYVDPEPMLRHAVLLPSEPGR